MVLWSICNSIRYNLSHQVSTFQLIWSVLSSRVHHLRSIMFSRKRRPTFFMNFVFFSVIEIMVGIYNSTSLLKLLDVLRSWRRMIINLFWVLLWRPYTERILPLLSLALNSLLILIFPYEIFLLLFMRRWNIPSPRYQPIPGRRAFLYFRHGSSLPLKNRSHFILDLMKVIV